MFDTGYTFFQDEFLVGFHKDYINIKKRHNGIYLFTYSVQDEEAVNPKPVFLGAENGSTL